MTAEPFDSNAARVRRCTLNGYVQVLEIANYAHECKMLRTWDIGMPAIALLSVNAVLVIAMIQSFLSNI